MMRGAVSVSGWKRRFHRPDKEFGIIVRTNAADASKEEILKELEYLKGVYRKAAVDGRSRTCFSCVYKTEPFYISAVRDANSRNLEEIVTDSPEISQADFRLPGHEQSGGKREAAFL